MNEATTYHRLDGLEPDNLLAFLTLLGLLRTLERSDARKTTDLKHRARTYWDLDVSPLRPVLYLARPATRGEVTEAVSDGLALLACSISLGDCKDLNYSRREARIMLQQASEAATRADHDLADLLASLMSDAAVKPGKKNTDSAVDPTPFCLLFGQGHQHFLERLHKVPAESAPSPRGHGKAAVTLSSADCIREALFEPWHRSDLTWSFRWDPEEDVRYALMAGNPTDPTYKGGTQHGANRLAAMGMAVLTVVPETRAGRVRPAVLGGTSGADGFSFSWPIWKEPATLSGIRALLGHPELRKPGALMHVGVDHVLTAKRISVGKFMNFTRARVEQL